MAPGVEDPIAFDNLMKWQPLRSPTFLNSPATTSAGMPAEVKSQERQIFDDLRDGHFGIYLWDGSSLDLTRRVLLSDYLVQVTQGVKDNITEAQLHYLEWLGASERQAANFHASSRRNEGLSHTMSRTPADDRNP
jgi:hypothetical protein